MPPSWRAGRPSGRRGGDAAVVGVPGHGGGRIAAAELVERGALVGVPLSDVLVEGVDGVGVAGEEGFESAAGADGAELVVVADHDDLGSVDLGGGEQGEHGRVVDHACLVDDQHGRGVEAFVAVLQSPQETGGGAGLEVGGGAEGLGGLAGGGRAQHPVALVLVGGAQGVERGGLAGAGDTEDQFKPIRLLNFPQELADPVHEDPAATEALKSIIAVRMGPVCRKAVSADVKGEARAGLDTLKRLFYSPDVPSITPSRLLTRGQGSMRGRSAEAFFRGQALDEDSSS